MMIVNRYENQQEEEIRKLASILFRNTLNRDVFVSLFLLTHALRSKIASRQTSKDQSGLGSMEKHVTI